MTIVAQASRIIAEDTAARIGRRAGLALRESPADAAREHHLLATSLAVVAGPEKSGEIFDEWVDGLQRIQRGRRRLLIAGLRSYLRDVGRAG